MLAILQRKRLSVLFLTLLLCLICALASASGKLDTIAQRGELLVGATGDYKPLSYLDKETGLYEGLDAEAAALLAKAMGVEVRFVPTSWPTLTQDMMAGKFDIAMCGITGTVARQKLMDQSKGYLTFGKTILVRKADADKFHSIEDVNKPSVRIMLNPGGTNEKFVRANLTKAQVIMHDKNEEIPGLIAAGEADVMVTDTIEASHYVHENAKLAAPLYATPFTNSVKCILMEKGDQDFLNFINFWLEESERNGTLADLRHRYLFE